MDLKRALGNSLIDGKSNSAANSVALSNARIGWMVHVGNFISTSSQPDGFRGWMRENEKERDRETMGMKIKKYGATYTHLYPGWIKPVKDKQYLWQLTNNSEIRVQSGWSGPAAHNDYWGMKWTTHRQFKPHHVPDSTVFLLFFFMSLLLWWVEYCGNRRAIYCWREKI